MTAEESLNPAPDSHLKWYVVHTSTGFEMKAKKALEERIKAYHLEDRFGEVLVPQEKVVETAKNTGKKKTVQRKFLPGYLLVQIADDADPKRKGMVDQAGWHLVVETPKITGFVGNRLNPSPVTNDEVQRLTAQMTEAAEKPQVLKSFEKGENIRVVEGPFANFTGIVDEFKPDKGKVRVLVSIFGRATPVELDLLQVERA